MLYYCILRSIKLHLTSMTLATITIKTSSLKKEKAKNDNQIILRGKIGSIRSLDSILFIKSELPCRALRTSGVILNFTKYPSDLILVSRHVSRETKSHRCNNLTTSLQSFFCIVS